MCDFVTPIGEFWLHTRDHGIVALSVDPPDQPGSEVLCRLVGGWLQDYFSGAAPSLAALPLRPEGTAFQQRVWEAMRTIPAGRVESYGSLARRLGSAPRAVGRALALNPIPILLPCHRVVAADGDLTGYSGPGGVASKRFLLTLEGLPILEKKAGFRVAPPLDV
ncbi:MAG: methylated-DNA--[protein]-cysteine S-methyltransferase [Magnetococcales bacterium]|nr:methylated-DNA--[protein]-cysteine S-methyltransferase [Magnetococcales bacterium]